MSVLEKAKAIARSAALASANSKTAPPDAALLWDAPRGSKPIKVFASVNGYAHPEIIVGAGRSNQTPT